MLAYKTQISINDEFIHLKIPRNFRGKRVDIIVLETNELFEEDLMNQTTKIESFYEDYIIEENVKTKEIDKPNEFQQFLLSAPVWSDNQYQKFMDTRKLFNKWKID